MTTKRNVRKKVIDDIRQEYIYGAKSLKELCEEHDSNLGYIYKLSSIEKWSDTKRQFLCECDIDAKNTIKELYISASIALFKKNLGIYEKNLNSLTSIPVKEDRERVNLAVKLPTVLQNMQKDDVNTTKIKMEIDNEVDTDTKTRLSEIIAMLKDNDDKEIAEEELLLNDDDEEVMENAESF